MNSSAATSEAGPTVDEPSITIEPDKAPFASPSVAPPVSVSAAQPASTRTDADNNAAAEISFLFNVSPYWIERQTACLPLKSQRAS
jgi:hypothetical protein